MGAEGGMEDTGVTNAAVAEQLTLDPPAYEFFQAVRLLERLYPERRAVGRFGDPTREVAHFSARTVIAFPASESPKLWSRSSSWSASAPPSTSDR